MEQTIAAVPMRTIGPVKLIGPVVDDEIMVPLATYELPLWPSTNRGAKLSRQCGGILTTIIDERMTRSILLEAPNAARCYEVSVAVKTRQAELQVQVAKSSRFAKLIDSHVQIVGNLLFLRLEFSTGDAAGHNMVTQAADEIMAWLLSQYSFLRYVSISGNYCTDKKATAVNGILGRGRNVVAELLVPRDICLATLKTTPEKIADLNTKKNLLGTMLAGGMRSANAHFANLLFAFYLALGQDCANIVEGSQGIVFAEVREGDLYFSVTLPNIIVGTIGNGKDYPFVQKNLSLLGCDRERAVGENARRLAAIIAATVLCGEISLLAAQTNPGELMRAHRTFERHAHSTVKRMVAPEPMMITASAPGKIILSGEHAVVCGEPALALAIDRYASAHVLPQAESQTVTFDLLNLKHHKNMTVKGLRKIKERLSRDYHAFSRGELGIKDVLKLPHELTHYALSNFMERFNRFSEKEGIQLKTESTIPMGCGMGSSAAMILAIKFALAHHFKEDIDKEHLFQLALETENLQHGYSSGLDLRVSLQGGAIEYKQGQFSTVTMPDWPLYIVNTGSPESSTGECVMHTKPLLENGNLAAEMGSVTRAFKDAIQQQQFQELQVAIRANHQLLIALGVVPQSIQMFIRYLETQGAAAKICGAGSIRGNKAGIVLIVSERDPTLWCHHFGYQAEKVSGDRHGLRLD